jgi:hypothetical protein
MFADRSQMKYKIDDHSSTQYRALVYIRLCGRYRECRKIETFYEEMKVRGLRFTRMMYAHALFGTTPDPEICGRITDKILGDMAADKIKPDITVMRALIANRAGGTYGIDRSFTTFRKLEKL